MLPPEFGKGFGLYPNLLETREVIPDYTKRTLGGVIPLEGLEPDERVRELIPHAELMRRVKTTAPFLYSLIRTNPNTKVSTGYVKKGGQWFHDIVLADLITLLSGTEAESRVKHNAHIGISSYDDNNQKTGYKIYEYPDPNIINDTFYLIFEGVTDTGGTEEKIAKMLMSPMYRRVKPLVITVADKTEKRLKNGRTQKLAIPTLALMGVTGWVGGFGPDLKKQANGTSIGRVINGGSVVVLEKLPKTA